MAFLRGQVAGLARTGVARAGSLFSSLHQPCHPALASALQGHRRSGRESCPHSLAAKTIVKNGEIGGGSWVVSGWLVGG